MDNIPADREIEGKPIKTYCPASGLTMLHKGIKVQTFEEIDKIAKNKLQIYTDGSKGPLGVGYGFAAMFEDKLLHEGSYNLFTYASIFQAECAAVIKALNFVCQMTRNSSHDEIHIFTDSESLYTAYHSRKMQHELIEEMRMINLELYKKGVKIQINWIKAHADLTGNEIADYLAKAEYL